MSASAAEHPYDARFFDELAAQSLVSARRLLAHLIGFHPVHSMVDLGCGSGEWLTAAREAGVARVLGVDGEWARARVAPHHPFLARDLEREAALDGTFDLAVSLEVAEHLSAAASERLVDALCAAAPVVLFSAAVPHQPGDHHVNCAPQSHWSALFAERGHDRHDIFRAAFWDDATVAPWYRQNAFLFVAREFGGIDRTALAARAADLPLDLVHPELYAAKDRSLRYAESLHEEALARHAALSRQVVDAPSARFVAGTVKRFVRRAWRR